MAKKQLLAKLLGRRLSTVLMGKGNSSKTSRRSRTSPQGDTTQTHATPNGWDISPPLQAETIMGSQGHTRMQHLPPTHQDEGIQNESASFSRPITMATPPVIPPRHSSRHAPFRQRFWSISSSNHFPELDNGFAPISSASPRSVYVPRHAATDFSKTSSRRRTIAVERGVQTPAQERSRFSVSSDEVTLCSANWQDEMNPEDNIRDLDMWLATLHRQQALQALNTPAE